MQDEHMTIWVPLRIDMLHTMHLGWLVAVSLFAFWISAGVVWGGAGWLLHGGKGISGQQKGVRLIGRHRVYWAMFAGRPLTGHLGKVLALVLQLLVLLVTKAHDTVAWKVN